MAAIVDRVLQRFGYSRNSTTALVRKAEPQLILKDRDGIPHLNTDLLRQRIAERQREEQDAEARARIAERVIRQVTQQIALEAGQAAAGAVRTEFGKRESKDFDQALARKQTEVPIINDGRGNLPEIRVRYSSGYGSTWSGWGPHDYAKRVTAGYGRNSDVYACVSLIATAAKQVKWWDGSGASKSSPAVLAKSIGLDLAKLRERLMLPSQFPEFLKAKLDPAQSIELLKQVGGASFIEQWASYILLSGNCYVEVQRMGKRITFLYLDNPGLVTAEVNREALHANEAVEKWRVRNGFGGWRFIKPYPASGDDAAIVHSKLFNPTDPIYGMAPLEAAMLRVDLQNKSAAYGSLAFERGFVPGWIEAREGSDWTDTQVGQLKEKIKQSKAAGEELFLENALWHDSGIKPSESAMTDISLLSKRDIASVFHVDPALIGDTTARTYATYRESRRGLYMEAVVPLLTQFRDDWNRTIGSELGSPLDFDKDSFDAIAAAREEAADRVQKLWTSGLITQNEGRRDLEYEGVGKDGDVFYGPANLVPLGMDVEPEKPENA